MKGYYQEEIADAARPAVAPAQIRDVMNAVGGDIGLAASALGVSEAEVIKSTAVAEIVEDQGVADGYKGFRPDQQRMAFNQIAQLAVLGESDGIKLRAAQYILDHATVTADTIYRKNNGLDKNVTNAFFLSVQQARANVVAKYG